MFNTFDAFGIEALRFVPWLLYDKRWLNGQTTSAIDQIVSMQKLQRIVESFLAHFGQFFRFGWHQNASETTQILHGNLNAGIGHV